MFPKLLKNMVEEVQIKNVFLILFGHADAAAFYYSGDLRELFKPLS
jgi:hypothetical protein